MSSSGLETTLVEQGRSVGEPATLDLEASPLLSALRRAGTTHVYADTADVEELGATVRTGLRSVLAEVDGNTVNQPLVAKALDRYLRMPELRAAAEALHLHDEPPENVLPLLYAVVCGRIGSDVVRAFGAGRAWEVSLQLHMGLVERPADARRTGELIRRMVPSALVKVPFAPDAPHNLLVARDLERKGIPVNLTSTFSARQVAIGAMLADVTRTNVFMSRLDAGLKAEHLGEQVDLAAQRTLTRLREEEGVKTLLIVASMHDWRTFVSTAGCDAYTAPCPVIREFLAQDEFRPDDLRSRLGETYEDVLSVGQEVLDDLGADRVAALHRVDEGLLAFLRDLRRDPEFRRLDDGDRLFQIFDDAGFGDVFHSPTAEEVAELRSSKLPDLAGRLVDRIPLDTHYSLLANADFTKHQESIDARLVRALGG